MPKMPSDLVSDFLKVEAAAARATAEPERLALKAHSTKVGKWISDREAVRTRTDRLPEAFSRDPDFLDR